MSNNEEDGSILYRYIRLNSCNIRLATGNVNVSRHGENGSLLFRGQAHVSLQFTMNAA